MNYLITLAFVVALIAVVRLVLREKKALDRDNREGNRAFTLHLHAMRQNMRARR